MRRIGFLLGDAPSTISLYLRRKARRRGIKGRLETGGLTVIQRANSALDLILHFHTAMLDGVYALRDDRRPELHPVPAPTDEGVAAVVARVQRRVLEALNRTARRPASTGGRGANARELGITSSDGSELLPEALRDSPLLAAVANASVLGLVATGSRRNCRPLRLPGVPIFPDGEDPGDEAPVPERRKLGRRCAQLGGFNLHANTAIRANDRVGLEKLFRYLARPPVSNERLERLPDGRVLYRLKRTWSDGTEAVLYEPHEFIERLCALVPRPRKHLTRYHGVLAPAFKRRAEIVPKPASPAVETPAAVSVPPAVETPPAARGAAIPLQGEVEAPQGPRVRGRPAAKPARPLYRHPWAALLWRVFLVDALKCPRCGGRCKVVGAVTEAAAIRRILTHLNLPADPPVPHPPRPPPEEGVRSSSDDVEPSPSDADPPRDDAFWADPPAPDDF